MKFNRCPCDPPRILDEPWHCHRCGHDRTPEQVSPSTMRIAMAIAEYALGYRRADARRSHRETA